MGGTDFLLLISILLDYNPQTKFHIVVDEDQKTKFLLKIEITNSEQHNPFSIVRK